MFIFHDTEANEYHHCSTLETTSDVAVEAMNEGNLPFAVYMRVAAVSASVKERDMLWENGVLPGVDFPATLNR